ncbi:MAG: sugar phosphate isomerase/epimerase [Planctomycetaceae bacterium]
MTQPTVILSAFADEAANQKSVIEQFAACAAIGLRKYSPRFLDLDGSGTVKHVVDLNKSEYKKLNSLHSEYGMSVTSIGSRIGKVKLLDVDDGTHNVYIPFKKYLKTEVAATIRAAKALDAKLIRGFSFYHPRDEAPENHIPQAVDQLGEIVDVCAKAGIVYGLEVESNLIGQNGKLLAALAKKVKHPNMVLIFDGGNLSHQGFSPLECLEEFRAMLPYLGWMHVKDYRAPKKSKKRPGQHVDEDMDWNFVPANVGDSGHEFVFRELKAQLPKIERRLKKLGIPGYHVEMEPHLKGGGQFGGFSGPDGMGVATRALCKVLDYVGISYDLRGFAEIQKERGF